MKQSTKRRLVHLPLYAVLVALAALVYFSADWAEVGKNFFSPAGFGRPWEGDWGTWPDLVSTGLVNTIKYTAIAFAGGLALAVVMALMRLSSLRPYRWLATCFVEFFRSLPVIVVILTLAFGVPIAFQWSWPGGTVQAGLVALILVGGSYMAETLRAGIQAVPKGQAEAARSLGMSQGRTMITVVLPQAFRIVIPPLTNEFVLLLKDTSLLYVAGMMIDQRELATIANAMMVNGPTAGTSTGLMQAAILYLVITIPLTQLVAWLERRQQRTR
ncbi:amino acid ABC transporter permease [Nocardioides yefusunii]|uniref:Amino acid ABC transporter permease n=1 Tax=Nocardioides yefusunii TaxID=2500546 RepID=A0ABW1QXD3_9ACTN|nr:amino acid ABC transporter permease [Nocardioides yefusunii]